MPSQLNLKLAALDETGERLFSLPEFKDGQSARIPIIAKSALPQIVTQGFMSCIVLCVLSVHASHTASHTYGATLCAATCVAMFGSWSRATAIADQSKVPENFRFLNGDTDNATMLKEQAQEMAIDLALLGGKLIALPLYTLRLYQLAVGKGDIFDDKEVAVFVVLLGVLLAIVFRAALDEFVPPYKSKDSVILLFGIVLISGSVTCLVLVAVDLLQACEDSAGESVTRFFVWPLLTLPGIQMISVVGRISLKRTGESNIGYPETLSIIKRLFYATSDVLFVLLLAVATATAALGTPLGDYDVFPTA